MTKTEIERARNVCAVLNETHSGVFQVFGVNAVGFIIAHDENSSDGFLARRTLTRFDVDGGDLYSSDASEPLPWHPAAHKAWRDYKAAGK